MAVKFTTETLIETLENADKPVLVDFYADWCGPCMQLAPIVEELAEEETRVIIGKLNVDDAQEFAAEHRVMSIPTLVLFKGKTEIARKVGAAGKADLKQFIDSKLGE